MGAGSETEVSFIETLIRSVVFIWHAIAGRIVVNSDHLIVRSPLEVTQHNGAPGLGSGSYASKAKKHSKTLS